MGESATAARGGKCLGITGRAGIACQHPEPGKCEAVGGSHRVITAERFPPHFGWKGSLLYWMEGENQHLVLPMGLRAQLLFLAHKISLAGHQAADKTLTRLVQRFYWPGI